MGHLTRIHKVRARHIDQAPGVIVGLAGRRVARVNHRYAIHIEIIAIRSGIDWAQRHFPNAVSSLGHFGAGPVAGNIATRQAHGLGFGCQNAKGDMPVGGDFR